MLRIHRPVPEVDAPIFDFDVIQGVPEGFGFLRGLFYRLGFLFLDKIRKIIRRLVNPLDVDIGLLEPDLSEDEGQPGGYRGVGLRRSLSD